MPFLLSFLFYIFSPVLCSHIVMLHQNSQSVQSHVGVADSQGLCIASVSLVNNKWKKLISIFVNILLKIRCCLHLCPKSAMISLAQNGELVISVKLVINSVHYWHFWSTCQFQCIFLVNECYFQYSIFLCTCTCIWYYRFHLKRNRNLTTLVDLDLYVHLQCSQECGFGGVQTRDVMCIAPANDNRTIEDSFCDANGRPSSSRPCNRVHCPYQYAYDPWSAVSNSVL